MKLFEGIFGGLCLLFIGSFYFSDKTPVAAFREQALTSPPPAIRFQLDPGRSTFMVRARRGGLAWFKGKSHDIAVRDFSGTAELTLDAINPASLQMTIRGVSLEETGAVFTQQRKEIISKELDEIVLEAAKYPEITFKSTDVKGKVNKGQFEVEIGGDLTLHGVTKRIVIPATVTLEGEDLHAKGKFEIDRKDFNVNATNAFHGLVRIKHELQFRFDIVGRKVS